MQFMNDGKSTGINIHEQAKAAMGHSSDAPEQHDFFKPLNELDPLVKKQEKIPIPKYNFRIFHLAGPHAPEDDGSAYLNVMEQVTIGRFQLMDDKTYHSREGDIRVFLRWLELPKELWPDTNLAIPADGKLDAMMVDAASLHLVKDQPGKPKKKKKKPRKQKTKSRKPKTGK